MGLESEDLVLAIELRGGGFWVIFYRNNGSEDDPSRTRTYNQLIKSTLGGSAHTGVKIVVYDC